MSNQKPVLFVTGCYPKDNDYFRVHTIVAPQNAADVLSWRFIDGFDENLGDNFRVLTAPFIGYYPRGFKKLMIHDRVWSHKEGASDVLLGFVNIKGLETIIKRYRIYNYVKNWYKESENNRAVVFYSHYAGFMSAAGMIKRKMPDMHLTCIVTDMNEMDPREDLKGFRGRIKGIPRQMMINTTYKNLKYLSSFVLLAEPMKEPLGVGDRPYTIIEGIADTMHADKSVDQSYFPRKDSEFRVVYTGTLHKRYGALNLVNAVKCIADKNVHLWVCGSGDAVEELKEQVKDDDRIHFLGVVENEKAISLQSSADLLVNSMPNFGIHASLSFPSKTMEYMLREKPVLCFKVPGIPDEYDQYLKYFASEEPKVMAEDIMKIAMMSTEERVMLGKRNKAFVMVHKGSRVQVAKVINMLFGK